MAKVKKNTKKLKVEDRIVVFIPIDRYVTSDELYELQGIIMDAIDDDREITFKTL